MVLRSALLKKATNRARVAAFSAFAWMAVVGIGLFSLAQYEATPGPAAGANANIRLKPATIVSPGKMTLLMFVHPKCPCSEASLEELSQLMEQYGSRLSASVLIFQPSRQPDDWSSAAMWRRATEIPGVAVRADVDAILAKECGAQTSGQTYLYDENNRLVFSGGITGSRGHVGDNDGLEAVIRLISAPVSAGCPPTFAPVFGCPIYGCSRSNVKPSSASVKQ